MLAPTAYAAPARTTTRTRKHATGSTDELREGLLALRPELHGRALRLVRSATVAEDLVQDTMLRALRFQAQYKPDTNLRAWLHQIMFSVFVTRCRRLRIERQGTLGLTNDPCSWANPGPMAPIDDRIPPYLRRALDDLPVPFRRAVVLVDVWDLSYREAAQEMGVALGTVMSRLHRGRRALAEALRDAPELRDAA